MESGLFSTPQFAKFAEGVVLFMHNTSMTAVDSHPELLAEVNGICSAVCIMDAEGRVLARPVGSVDNFAAAHAQSRRVTLLRAKGEARTAEETKELFFAELALDLVPADAVSVRAAKLTLDDAEKAVVEQKLADIEIRALMRRTHELGPDALSARIAAMARAGRQPGPGTHEAFWLQALLHASAHKDHELAKQAFAALTAQRPGAPAAPAESRERWQKLVDSAGSGR